MPTAVIPTWNRRDLLLNLFDSLAAQTRKFDKIIVVDNGSTDDSADLAERAGATVLRLGQNMGFAAAVNRGIEAAKCDWVAIVNNDVTFQPDWLEKLLAARENAWFVTGKILQAADHTRVDGAFDELSRGACASRCGSGKYDGPVWNQPRRIRFAPMTAALFRRQLFRELGGLDERFGSYMEDVEFGLRCALAGRDGVYVPSAVSYHLGSATLGGWSKDTVWRIARNQVLLAAKHFPGQPRWPVVAGQLLWGLIALRHGCGVAYLRGKLAGIREAGRMGRLSTNEYTSKDLARVLEASEASILALAQETSFDSYWRAYFWLSPR
ncbi:MAG: glycosyltransferase family 2 protein [Acidobacteriota bacterium]|nr:glycosyltransferase family 2 protein [Acidobacteriota bacterium]